MLETAKQAAKEAGDFLGANFGNVKDVFSKGDRNLATNLDREAEKIAIDIISRKFPEHGILAEESGSRDMDREYLWIIDPLDGTHNFIRGLNIYGTSVGLWHKDDFILGAVYMPEDDEFYWAEKGKGAFKNGKPIKVSGLSEMKQASGSFDSSIRYSPKPMLAALDDIARACFNIRMFGSSVRALTYLAEGNLDFSVEFHDRPWDFAGSVCIIKEAGGIFLDLKNGALVKPDTIGYIAASPKIYPQLREIVDAALKV